jgi:hypothetical protein
MMMAMSAGAAAPQLTNTSVVAKLSETQTVHCYFVLGE